MFSLTFDYFLQFYPSIILLAPLLKMMEGDPWQCGEKEEAKKAFWVFLIFAPWGEEMDEQWMVGWPGWKFALPSSALSSRAGFEYAAQSLLLNKKGTTPPRLYASALVVLYYKMGWELEIVRQIWQCWMLRNEFKQFCQLKKMKENFLRK